MDPTISSDQLNTFFAYLPWLLGSTILLVSYVALRSSGSVGIPIKQSFACAKCGRRGHREHMVPVTQTGAVSWYCAHCSK